MKLHTLSLALLTASALLTSCDHKDKELPTPQPQTPTTPAPQGDQGFIRIVNNLTISPGSPLNKDKIRATIGGKEVEVSLGEATAYQPVAVTSTALPLQIKLPAKSGEASIFTDSEQPIQKDKRYSCFVYTFGASTYQTITKEDILPAQVPGKAHIRIVNLHTDTAPIKVQEVGSDAPLVANVDAGKFTEYMAVDARSYSLEAYRTNGTQAQLFTQPVALEAGKTYSLVVRGTNQPVQDPDEQADFDVIVDQ